MESQGGCATSIQWGAWSGGGMALKSSSTSSRLERVGMQALSSDEGLFVLGSILRSTYSGASVGMSLPLLAALPISWGRFLRRMVAGLLLGKLVLQLSSPNFLKRSAHPRLRL